MPDEPKSKSVTYADAGVDISSGDRAKERIKYLAQKTFNRNVLGGIGGFGALFRLDMQRWKNPILVSSADGVGTKLKMAFELGLHQTVGADLVNHCVNDIAVQGATPLFFLDYLASGKLDPEVTESVVTGLAEACKANGCALIGGETAQMPGFYTDGEYDLAGFIVGAVDRDKMVTGAGIKAGDVLIGLPSTGLHTNGYSLARKLFFEVAGYKHTQYVTAIREKAGAALMKTHRSYLHVIQKLVTAGVTTGIAHITGGGITGNFRWVLFEGLVWELSVPAVANIASATAMSAVGRMRGSADNRELLQSTSIRNIIRVPLRIRIRLIIGRAGRVIGSSPSNQLAGGGGAAWSPPIGTIGFAGGVRAKPFRISANPPSGSSACSSWFSGPENSSVFDPAMVASRWCTVTGFPSNVPSWSG